METNKSPTTEKRSARNHAEILRFHFQAFSENHLTPTKGGSGSSLSEIKKVFIQYLEASKSPITELSNIQMGLLMNQSDKLYVRRKTSKGAHYLVSVITHVI